METMNKKVYFASTTYALITGLSFLFRKVALNITDPLNLLAHRFKTYFQQKNAFHRR